MEKLVKLIEKKINSVNNEYQTLKLKNSHFFTLSQNYKYNKIKHQNSKQNKSIIIKFMLLIIQCVWQCQ